MRPSIRALAVAVVAGMTALAPPPFVWAQQPAADQDRPRFRAGANLVRVDAYVSLNGAAIADLTLQDFEVFEDGAPQRLESFEVIRPRGPAPQNAVVEPNTIAESRAMATDADSRLFVLFMDVFHVHLEGSYRAQNPIVNFLNKVIGQDDMIGVMTTEMSARNLTLARKTATIEGILRDNWFWGERQRLITSDPRERELQDCYPDTLGSLTVGLAQQLIDRRRERKTLDAIEDLILHLEGIREERKFVIMLTEGWQLPRRDDNLARSLDKQVPGVGGIYVGPSGKLAAGEDPRQTNRGGYDSCERERVRLASEDLAMDFQTLLQRANRANISFYPVDPRGMVVFDEDLSLRRASNITADRAMLGSRQNALRDLAGATDGVAILNTNNLDGALGRMMSDIGTYYLLGYYSTNTKLDGRFRKLSVKVKRPGLDVRARPGYLAPTEAEAASARVNRLMNGAAPGHSDTPPEFRRALERLAPARGNVPVRVAAAGAAGQILITTELDASTMKLPEWAQGGRARVVLEHDRGAAPPIERDITIAPGQRTFSLTESESMTLPPGRYVIRLSLTAQGSALPLQTTADVTVPAVEALIGSSGLAARRGPSTGLQYNPTADARFLRTERIRLEVPRLSAEGTVTARLLNREGNALPLTVGLGERTDEARKLRLIVTDLTLAPLAQGEYVLEVAIEQNGKKESISYGFRVVP